MARDHAKSDIKQSRRQSPRPRVQGKRPQRIEKGPAPRKSLRIQAIRQSHKQSRTKGEQKQEVQAPLSPPASTLPKGRKVFALVASPASSADLVEAPYRPEVLQKPSASSRKRKRGPEEQELVHPSFRTQEQPPPQRLRISPASNISEGSIDPLQHWVRTGHWSKEYFEQDSQVREDFDRGRSPEVWVGKHYSKKPFRTMQALAHLNHLFAKKKSSASLRRKQSQSSLQTLSDQLPREQKSAPYKNPNYPVELEEEGSYMRDFDENDDIPRSARDLCRILLKTEQTVPRDTLFRDDLFKKTCRNLQDRNEAMVIRDIGLLIAPSAQTLATYGATHLNFLYETTNEGWNSIYPFPLHRTRPQPDFSVGFGRSAFNQEQLTKLKPFAGEPGSITFFMATARMFFPFLTCEVKCGAAALDIADRQNAHSMTVAVRALVELFRAVQRERELDRKILTFSVSHDHTSVRIYGHYAVIEGQKTAFYRHTMRKFDFTEQDGEEKWTAYKFVKNVYDYHSPKLHGMICSCLDHLPVIDSQSAFFSHSTSQNSQAESTLGEEDSQSSVFASQEPTPTTSFTQANEPASKKLKKPRTGGKR